MPGRRAGSPIAVYAREARTMPRAHYLSMGFSQLCGSESQPTALVSIYHDMDAIVTAITSSGLARNGAPLRARGQDAFLVCRRLRDRAQLATSIVFM